MNLRACFVSLPSVFFLFAACSSGTANLGGGAAPDAGSPSAHDDPRAPASDGSSAVTGDSSSPTKPKAPLDPNLALRAAAFVGSCVPDDGTNRYLDTMYASVDASPDVFYGLFLDSLPCFASKTNGCQAVTECLGVSVSVVVGCSESCDGDVTVQCDNSTEFRQDCKHRGEQCVLAGTRPTCVAPGTTPTACDYDTFSDACEDGRPTYCLGERRKAFGSKCSDFGLGCTTHGDEQTHVCKGLDGACEASSYGPGSARYEGIACNGTSLEACVNGGKTTLSCPTVATGFTCQATATKTFCGLAAECEPRTKATCEGTNLVTCNAGKVTKVDCTTLGFTGCNAQHGVCTPTVGLP